MKVKCANAFTPTDSFSSHKNKGCKRPVYIYIYIAHGYSVEMWL